MRPAGVCKHVGRFFGFCLILKGSNNPGPYTSEIGVIYIFARHYHNLLYADLNSIHHF